MGLALLANLSAHDFGYISTRQLIERTTNTLATMEALERYRGHFYNWYDTLTLKPLPPKYVSTVDSGNLAAHLLTLRQGLIALPERTILGPQFFDGLRDTLRILLDAAAEAHYEGECRCLARPDWRRSWNPRAMSSRLRSRLPGSALSNLQSTQSEALSIIDSSGLGREHQAGWWARAFAGQCRAALDELTLFAPSIASRR